MGDNYKTPLIKEAIQMAARKGRKQRELTTISLSGKRGAAHSAYGSWLRARSRAMTCNGGAGGHGLW
jgi:hypothetical protein